MYRNQVVQNYMFSNKGHFSAWCETYGINQQQRVSLYAFLKGHQDSGEEIFTSNKWGPLLSYVAERIENNNVMDKGRIKSLFPPVDSYVKSNNKSKMNNKGAPMYPVNVNQVPVSE